MLEAKLWHSKTKTKNVKAAKMVVFIKTCDQYPSRFNFGNFFYSIMLFYPLTRPLPPSLVPFLLGKIRFSENSVREEWVISFCQDRSDRNLGHSFSWGHEQKWTDSIFWLTNVLASNLSTVNFKLFGNHDGIYRFRKISRKILKILRKILER